MSDSTVSPALLRSVPNFRDLADLPGPYAAALRRGRIFRTSHFGALSDEEQAFIDQIGIRTVVDLRGVAERAAAPGYIAARAVSDVHLPIEPRAVGTLRAARAAGEVDDDGVRDVMRKVYRRFVFERTETYTSLLQLLLDEANYPFAFHCTAGKDRTGFGAALILLAVDIPRAAIIADFMRSNGLWRPAGATSDVSVLSGVHAEYLEVAFAAMEERHGSIDAYLEQALGIGPAQRETLRRLLLSPA
ncbi:MAG: tyrosine-protein phosphatase [Janthinobacterium lividum]